MNYTLEPLTDAHRVAAMEIFNHYIADGFAAYFEMPLPDAFFDRFLELAKGYPAFAVRSDGGEVAGFGFLRAYHPAPTLRRTAEIAYFLHPGHTRRGVGRLLLDRLIEEARRGGIDCILANICSRNEASLAFHRKHGFAECGRFKAVGRKFGAEFDVVWMQRSI